MSGIFNVLAMPMGQFLYFIYNTIGFKSYGLAIIIFTVLIKLVLLPLSVKQYKSMARMQEVQPLIAEIQKRYKNDKEKLNQEMMKVYSDNKVNPAGGCLPILIQMPILLSLYWVISQPLTYMLGKKQETINFLIEYVNKATEVVATTGRGYASQKEINVIHFFSNNMDQVSNVSDYIKPEDIINLKFLGLNLGLTPSWHFATLTSNMEYAILLIIPILAVLTTFLSVKFSSNQNQAVNSDNQMQNSMQKSMMYMMPIMTGMFSFSLPAGMGLYWIISNVFQIFQQWYLNTFVKKKGVSSTK